MTSSPRSPVAWMSSLEPAVSTGFDEMRRYFCGFEGCTDTKGFTRIPDLDRHMKQHSPELEALKLPCSFPPCPFRTLQKSGLEAHENAMHRGVRIPCGYCHKEYKHRRNRDRHEMKEHREQVMLARLEKKRNQEERREERREERLEKRRRWRREHAMKRNTETTHGQGFQETPLPELLFSDQLIPSYDRTTVDFRASFPPESSTELGTDPSFQLEGDTSIAPTMPLPSTSALVTPASTSTLLDFVVPYMNPDFIPSNNTRSFMPGTNDASTFPPSSGDAFASPSFSYVSPYTVPIEEPAPDYNESRPALYPSPWSNRRYDSSQLLDRGVPNNQSTSNSFPQGVPLLSISPSPLNTPYSQENANSFATPQFAQGFPLSPIGVVDPVYNTQESVTAGWYSWYNPNPNSLALRNVYPLASHISEQAPMQQVECSASTLVGPDSHVPLMEPGVPSTSQLWRDVNGAVGPLSPYGRHNNWPMSQPTRGNGAVTLRDFQVVSPRREGALMSWDGHPTPHAPDGGLTPEGGY